MKWKRSHSAAAFGVVLLAASGAVAAADSVAPQPVTQSDPSAQVTITMAAAGDICGSACDQTAALLTAMNPDAILTMGDNTYDSGSLSEYRSKYDPFWGKFKSITHPTPGNHEYYTTDARGYFDYYNGVGASDGRAGERGKGYYSRNIGSWHVIALNSEVSTSAGSAQEKWLRADLAANTQPCTIAAWHHPRFSNGSHGDDTTVTPLYQALYDHKADLILGGHDHNYERFAPARPNGTRDDVNGVRQLVVGTGGISLRGMSSGSDGPSERQNANTHGVLKLDLSPTGYTSTFVPVAGRTFTDTVSGTCKKANQQPAFDVTVSPTSVSVAPGGTTTSTVKVNSRNGFAAATTLSAANLPAGVTGTFSPATVTPAANGSATSTLTLTAAGPPGATTAKVTGTSGGLTDTADLGVTVTDPNTPGGFTDDFESDKGWTVNPSGTDSATTGKWERGDPDQTANSAGVKQLGTAAGGVSALSTGRAAGSGYGANDVDGGSTSVRSPSFTVPSGTPRLGFSYNVAHDVNSGPDDYLRVRVVDGSAVTTVFEKLGTPSDVLGAWRTASVDLSAYAGRAVSLLVEAKDGGPPTLFEAQVDSVAVTSTGGFADDFESDKGWTVNPAATDTATTGKWERGDPEATAKQLGTTVDGANALNTGRLAGSSHGANDVDGGSTSIRSPAITVPSGAPRLTFSYNMAHDLNSGPDDYLRVRVVDGSAVTTVFEKLGAPSEVAGPWQAATVDLSAYAGRTIALLIEARDGGAATLFEAQVDALRIG
ncbi:choice-of-anchor J domain-containing protein [Actinokineospora xionganensis]|nr:choice-of-anchor J domain-containing protein [Actinokineospora xionganensis]